MSEIYCLIQRDTYLRYIAYSAHTRNWATILVKNWTRLFKTHVILTVR